MKKLVGVVIAFLALGTVQFASAQDPKKGNPVEFYGCNWQDGKGMADLVKVGKKFDEWASKQGSMYSAWIMTPQFHTDIGFDVGWLGGWPDGAEMGKTLDGWKSGGRELAADFQDVMDCSGRHELATSVPLHAPKGAGADGIAMFSACKLADGKMGTDALAAHAKAGAAMRAKGSKAASSWAFFPGLGAADYEFDYWQVITFASYADFGATSEIYINGGGWQETMAALKGVTQCAGAVMFDVVQVRNGNPG